MKFPSNWLSINVAQFIELFSLNLKEFDSQDDYYIQILSILSNQSIDDIEDLDYDDFKQHIANLNFIYRLPTKQPSIKLKIEDTDLYLMDLTQLTIGEFIDLEHFITDGYTKNLNVILSILYRRKTIHSSPFILDEFESYGNWIYHRASLFDDICVNDVYGVINNYMTFRANIFDTYQGLFDNEDPQELDIDDSESFKSKLEKTKANNDGKAIRKWGWDALLLKLAKNDPSRLNEVTGMPLIQALNVLSMVRELGIEF